MIGKLTGYVVLTGADHLVLEVGGVGYIVQCPSKTLQQLSTSFSDEPTHGIENISEKALPSHSSQEVEFRQRSIVSLWIETQVREDSIRLFGFVSLLEKNVFHFLQKVQGVGSRIALAVLSHLSIEEILYALTLQDARLLSKVPGVGAKLAARIITELKDKRQAFEIIQEQLSASAPSNSDSFPSTASPVARDAVSALLHLGYSSDKAHLAVGESFKFLGREASLESVLQQALRALSS